MQRPGLRFDVVRRDSGHEWCETTLCFTTHCHASISSKSCTLRASEKWNSNCRETNTTRKCCNMPLGALAAPVASLRNQADLSPTLFLFYFVVVHHTQAAFDRVLTPDNGCHVRGQFVHPFFSTARRLSCPKLPLPSLVPIPHSLASAPDIHRHVL